MRIRVSGYLSPVTSSLHLNVFLSPNSDTNSITSLTTREACPETSLVGISPTLKLSSGGTSGIVHPVTPCKPSLPESRKMYNCSVTYAYSYFPSLNRVSSPLANQSPQLLDQQRCLHMKPPKAVSLSWSLETEPLWSSSLYPWITFHRVLVLGLILKSVQSTFYICSIHP